MSELAPTIASQTQFPIGRMQVRSSARVWGKRLSVLCALIWVIGLLVGFQTSVLLVTLVGLVATVVGIARPTLGVMGIGILCTMDALTRVFLLTGGLLRWNTFNYVLLLAMSLSLPILLRRREAPTRILQFFVALLILQLFSVRNLESGVQHILGAVAFFGLLLYFARAARDPAIWQWVAIVSGVVAAGGGLVYFQQESNLPYINKNAWMFLPLTAIFAACLARSYPANQKSVATLLWLLVIINVIWVVLSGSRGGMTIAAACLLYLLTSVAGVSRRVLVVAAGSCVAVIAFSFFAEQKEYVLHRFDKSVDSEISLAARTSGRSDLVIGGWRIFLEHPILGVGTGGFAAAWRELSDREGMSGYADDRASEAHSGWIKTLAEAGIPGIALHFAFVCSFFVVGWQSGDRALIRLGLLVTVSLTVAFVSTEFQGKAIWFLAAGATVVLDRESARIRSWRMAWKRSPAGHAA